MSFPGNSSDLLNVRNAGLDYPGFRSHNVNISGVEDTNNLVDNAGLNYSGERLGPSMDSAPMAAKVRQFLGDAKDKVMGAGSSALGYLKDHPDAVKGGLGALGLAAGGAGLYHLLNKKKKNQQEEELQPKEAAYYEGMLKRAQEYNLTPSEISYLLNVANNR